jgi:N-acyl-D-aspartate/D-glutamate deacylase
MKFDLIIRNATVIDGSGAPAFEGDVALAAGRIASAGTPSGAWAVDELEDEKLRKGMGVTTEIIGQCGYFAFPVDDRHRGLRAERFDPQHPPPDRARIDPGGCHGRPC